MIGAAPDRPLPVAALSPTVAVAGWVLVLVLACAAGYRFGARAVGVAVGAPLLVLVVWGYDAFGLMSPAGSDASLKPLVVWAVGLVGLIGTLSGWAAGSLTRRVGRRTSR